MKTFKALCKHYGIAITGGIATGKSQTTKILRSMGYLVVDADQLSRQVVEKGKPAWKALRHAFGDTIFLPSEELDRKALAELIFKEADHREKVEAILHPAIREEFQEVTEAHFKNSSLDYFFYEAALIFEAGVQDRFKEVWLLTSERQKKLSRASARDGVDVMTVEARLQAQMDEKEAKHLANVTIENNGSLEELEEKIKTLVSQRLHA